MRRKKVSARELLQLTFDRIERHNPALNAIVWQDRDGAMPRARDADAAAARPDDPTARWIGKGAVKELTRPLVMRRLPRARA